MKGPGFLSLLLLGLLCLLCECRAPSAMQRLGARRRLRLLRLANGTLSRASRPVAAAQRDDSSSSPRGRYRSRSLSRGSRSGEPAPAARSRQVRVPAAGTPSLMAGMAGKQRLWVISAPHAADGYYRLMLSLLKDDVYCELAERHIYQLVLFHQDGEVGGKLRKITNQGTILEEALDASTVLKLLDFLKLERGKFSMVLLRKNLQLEETYPYPVRLEAMYEMIDQGPIRKMEKLRQKGFVQKCKQAGLEGKVIGPSQGKKKNEEKLRPTPTNENVEVPTPKETREEKVLDKKKKVIIRKPIRISLNTHGGSKLVRATVAPVTSTTRTIKPTNLPPATTTVTDFSTTVPSTTAFERQGGTSHFTRSHVILLPSSPKFHKPAVNVETSSRSMTDTNSPAARGGTHRDRHQTVSRIDGKKSSKTLPFYPPVPTSQTTTVSPGYTKEQTTRHKYNRADKKVGNYHKKGPRVTPILRKPTKVKTPKSKSTNNKILINEYEDKYDPEKTSSTGTGQEVEVSRVPLKKGKEQKKHGKPIKSEKKNKPVKSEKKKPVKKDKVGKKIRPMLKTKPLKETKHKNPKKTTKKGIFKQPKKIPGMPKTLASILSHFENRRRLILITSPNDRNNMYEQQRDEYLEHVCEMALRKISIITIFGPLNNSTIKIDHYQLDNEKPVKDIRHGDLDQGLITELRKEYGITENEFFMVLTDVDMRVKQHYEVPIAMQAVFNLIDTFTTRIKEMEKQKRDGTSCKKENKPRSLENFLSRFRWRRRLFIISTPTDEEWAYQHQLYALNSQACNLGLRHLAVLKLMGVGIDVGGVLELYPINGSATVDREDLSPSLVQDIRNYFQVSPEYFSMLLVGKDGNVKSWYPTPMWNMAIVYDLVDSMQLRRQEMAIQQSLGMRCPEDEYGYGYHGYQDGYHQQGHYGGYHY
ncbi:coiled-coil domain-containing protein 80 [Chiloscyllium plagiosum]|uniref:coiled-coil domain-containing protein 80 n=1 Tax=Chiloscyllium plagiosum TaxID=36176 RepID=UPI001CB7C895|nr:coiled-coil domain-containing protein 80 [Chiloscyllium plagiosum]